MYEGDKNGFVSPSLQGRTPPPVPSASHLALMALGWTVFVVYGSLVPLKYHAVELAVALEQFRNLPPLWFGMGTRADWVANILLFIPLTFLWMGALTCDRGRAARIAAALLLVPAGAAAAVALEFTQIWFVGRTVSRNDIVAETLGSVIGVISWSGIGPHMVEWLRTFSRDRRPRSQYRWLLEAYLLGLVVYSVVPLDLTISLAELYHKYQSGGVLLVPFSYHYSSPSAVIYQFFADVAEFVPVGAWVVLTQGHRVPDRPSVFVGVVGGALIAAAIECAQLVVLSRFVDTTDIVLGTIGAGVGGWLVGRYDLDASGPLDAGAAGAVSRHWVRSLAAIVLYSLFLVAGFWFPFEFTHDRALIASRLDGFFRVPFFALYVGSEFNAITQVLIRLFLFAPLGVMWAYVAGLASTGGARRLLGLSGLFYSAALALGIEVGEVAMPSKIADSTEVIICAAGAAVGFFVAARLLDTRVGRGRVTKWQQTGGR